MNDKSLLKKITEYSKAMTPFHMPGHKRVFNKNSLIPYSIDITEVEGFDNLHNMQGILKDTSDNLQGIYKSFYSFPLVNGSTCGILAGIYVLTRKNINILVARNCHKSVYNAVEVLDLNAHYIAPKMCDLNISGTISAKSIEEAIISHNIGTVIITSPTYDGIISDVEAIYEVCKKHGAYLFVDCAHGAHFGLSKTAFAEKVTPYCDLCVMSLHKTLPSLTQTAVLHACSGRIEKEDLRHALSIFETSSPSYVLLSSIDECTRFMTKNIKILDSLEKSLDKFYVDVTRLLNLNVFCFDDKSKILISAESGAEVAEKLRQEKIEVEMISSHYVLAIATIADTKKNLKKLKRALFKIDKSITPLKKLPKIKPAEIPEKAISATAAQKENGYFMDINDAAGKVSLEYIFAYPPGSPIIVPGEIIDENLIKRTSELLSSKVKLISTKNQLPKIYTK